MRTAWPLESTLGNREGKEKACIMLLKYFKMVKQHLHSPAGISVCFYSEIQIIIALDFVIKPN